MIWATRIVSLISLLALTASLPLEQDKREIYEPWITSPDEHTTWRLNSQQTVVWDTTNAPPNFDECEDPYLYLIPARYTQYLTHGFPLSPGNVTITVPGDYNPGQYRVDLMACGYYEATSQRFTLL
ncbi:hypothetical protein EV363DRAFT_1401433 [Boletus edulis]|nr:hypothetical protein EV363DRAFT_1183407 [Boletus edulis]KAF8126999.1 hypothetical protein EV363DRAFT_1401433 [Boletus edulis]